jgi:hypothetical protein
MKEVALLMEKKKKKKSNDDTQHLRMVSASFLEKSSPDRHHSSR